MAEFRKVAVNGRWRVLMTVAVLLALGWAVGSGFFPEGMYDRWGYGQRTLAGPPPIAYSPWAVFGIAKSINFATILPMVFAGLAVTNEIKRRKTDASDHVGGLGAKTIAYVLWGTIFGIVIVFAVSCGTLLIAHPRTVPNASGWLALAGAGVLTSILMTLFGTGVGALLRNPTITTAVLVLYMLIIENGVHFQLSSYGDLRSVIGFLPNGSANGVTGSVAADVYATAENVPEDSSFLFRANAGAPGALDWWLSGLVFLAWTGIFLLAGWAIQRKKVT